ncbi:DUF2637 domain-containing protein [Rhodococcus pyridinivorans]|uniref:DUF2637 domain-containing protein n=1 Tax=Rhodococcus pyridinivorans TaxID=103816 RepID=UPI0022852325|nr:DUF2637 domain-containing protein [Rhodococcus pyridinivorans]WAL49706.1 DUF2637 domain-containing protein [Rhodococcus pyridinivorans]
MTNLTIRAARIQLYGLMAALLLCVLITVGLTTGAFILSFDVLRDLALQGMVSERWTWIFPAIVDGAIVGATIAVVVLNKIGGSSKGKNFFVALLVAAVCISVVGNAFHAYKAVHDLQGEMADGFDPGFAPLAPMGAAVIAVIPPILMLLFTHGIGILVKAIGTAYSEYTAMVHQHADGESAATEVTPVAAGNATPTVPVGNATPTVPVGNATPTVPVGNATPTVPVGNATPTTPAGNATPTVPVGNATPTVPVSNATRAIASADRTMDSPTTAATTPMRNARFSERVNAASQADKSRNAMSTTHASNATPDPADDNATVRARGNSAALNHHGPVAATVDTTSRPAPPAASSRSATTRIAAEESVSSFIPETPDRAVGSTEEIATALDAAGDAMPAHVVATSIADSNGTVSATPEDDRATGNDEDAPRVPFAERVASRIAQLDEEDIAAKFDKRSAPAFGDTAESRNEHRTVEELLQFIENADLDEAVKQTAKLKINRPDVSFAELAELTGARAASTAMRRYKKAEAAAMAAGFSVPPLPDLSDGSAGSNAPREAGLIGAT